jgi:hypothetical protein
MCKEEKEHEIVINVIKSSRGVHRFPPVAAEMARQEIEFHPGGTATGILLK